MAVVEISKILVRRGKELQTGIPRLEAGEFGWAEDTENLYIGKRVSEGAVSDENTRILTENDLNFFSLLATNTGSVTSAYRYRDAIDGSKNPFLVHVSTQTVQTKLDSLNPSLVDFGLVISTTTSTVISIELQNAINDLFANEQVNDPLSFTQTSLRRVLALPAGSFVVTAPVDLPPYTKLIGAGPELTKIKYTSSTTNMFRTVDADGNRYEDGMVSGALRARDVHIEGMTLEFDNTLSNSKSLISLDNVYNARVKNCVLRTRVSSPTSSTYGLIDHGVGITVRGSGGVGSELCENVFIEDCVFDALHTAVYQTGSVVKSVISDGLFSNLQLGVVTLANGQTPGSNNSSVINSKFRDVVSQAIYVGSNPNNERSNFLSSNNYFKDVGNGPNLKDNTPTTSTSCTSVISFQSSGCRSVDDSFNRRNYADLTTSSSFYYNPLVQGNATISDLSVSTATIAMNSVPKSLAKIAVNGSDQLVTMQYQVSKAGYSRKGTLRFNITPEGAATYSDDYLFSEYLSSVSEGNLLSEEGSGPNLLVVNPTSIDYYTELVEALYNFQPGIWYISSSAPGLEESAAFIESVNTSSGMIIISTGSVDPLFDFSDPANEYLLLRSYSGEVTFNFVNNLTKNYIEIIGINDSTDSDAQMEYQVDIQT
jgi:hypothetical protein